MSDPKNRERLDRIYDALEASLADMSGDELREVVRARGKDPDQVVSDVRTMFGSIAKEHRQARLNEARTRLAAARQAHAERPSHIPTDPAAQRALYYQVAQRHPQFTMKHRDLEALPPEELAQVLRQMDALGLLPDEES